ncbi:MAG TPA: hypothetical protein VHS56_14625 [Candidatus Cybelea sp.]|nr:hypothetical protein [Candidatus Cybelea sp.]
MKFPTIVLAVGAAVLLLAVVIGQRMGDRVMQQATQTQLNSVMPTPLPTGADASPQPYGPDWKRSEALSAAGDPRFPDPRVPPQPVPTAIPATPKPPPTPTPVPTATVNPNIPVWRQKPLPVLKKEAQPLPSGGLITPAPEASGAESPTPPPLP